MTHNAFNFRNQHILDYLNVLTSGISHNTAHQGCTLIEEADFQGHWQAATVWSTIQAVTNDAINNGHGNDPLTIADINERLVLDGHIKKDELKTFWLNFVSPLQVPKPLGAEHLPTLARRIIEDHFRTRHSDVFSNGISHTAPLADLCQQMDNDRQTLIGIYQRLTNTPQFALVKAGDAA